MKFNDLNSCAEYLCTIGCIPWAQEDDCNWGGGADPFILLHVMFKYYDTKKKSVYIGGPQKNYFHL